MLHFPLDLTTRFLFVVYASCRWLDAVSLEIVVNPSPVILGPNSYEITCRYTLSSPEVFHNLSLIRLEDNNIKYILVLFMKSYGDRSESFVFFHDAVPDLRHRGTGRGSRAEQMVQLHLNETVCRDEKIIYQCRLGYSRYATDIVRNALESKEISVTALPQPPDVFEVDTGPGPKPTDSRVDDGKQVIFVCSANMGNPAKPIRWFASSGQGRVDVLKDISKQAEITKKLKISCTWKVSSRLTLSLTRKQFGDTVAVRCSTDGSLPKQCGAFCKMSQTFTIVASSAAQPDGGEKGNRGNKDEAAYSKDTSGSNMILYISAAVGTMFLVAAILAVLAYVLYPRYKRPSVAEQPIAVTPTFDIPDPVLDSGKSDEDRSEQSSDQSSPGGSQGSGSDVSYESRV